MPKKKDAADATDAKRYIDQKNQVESLCVLLKISGKIHPVDLTFEQEERTYALLGGLCGGRIKVLQTPLEGVEMSRYPAKNKKGKTKP